MKLIEAMESFARKAVIMHKMPVAFRGCGCLAAGLLLAAGTVQATTYTWTQTAGGPQSWNVGANWSGGSPVPVSGDTVDFSTVNIAADTTLTLDADRTATTWKFGDTSGAQNWIVNSGYKITLAGATPTINVAQNIVTLSNVVDGTAGLVKSGTGTLTLSGSNTYSGTTTISAGILAISHNNALGDTSGNTTLAATGASTGPQLVLSNNITSAENITLTGITEQNNYIGAIYNTSGTNTLSGNITLVSPTGSIRITSAGGELVLGGTVSQTGTTRTLVLQALSGAAITVNSAIANNNGALNILGNVSGATGTVTLKAACTAINAATVGENGTLKLGVTNALNTTSTLTLGFNYGSSLGADYGIFDLAGFNQTVSALIGTKNGTSNIGLDSKRVVTNSAASGTSVLTVGNSNGSGTFNGVILDGATAAVALTKIGTGTQTLTGDSTYSGVTTISGGILAITHNNALGTTAGNTTIAATGASTGPLLQLSNNINSPENITITGATESSGYNGAIQNTSGTNTLSGNITLSSLTGGIRLSSAGTLIFSGNISQTGASQTLALQANANQSITVNNAIANNGGDLCIYGVYNTTAPTGTTTLKGVSGSGIGNTLISQAGRLVLGVTDALKTTANLTLGTGASQEDVAAFDLAGFNQTVNGLIGTSGGHADSYRTVTNSVTGTSTLTVGNGNGSGTFNGQIMDGGAGKILALIKTGSGTQTLNGANTYMGNTTINGGTLKLTTSGTLANTPRIGIASNATFDVSAAGITLTGSGPQQTLACSSTNGTAAINATGHTVTLNSGALLSFQAAGGSSSTNGKISVTGHLTLNANAVTVNVTGSALVAGTYRLLECTGTLANTGTFTQPTITGTRLLGTASISMTPGASGHIDLTVGPPLALVVFFR